MCCCGRVVTVASTVAATAPGGKYGAAHLIVAFADQHLHRLVKLLDVIANGLRLGHQGFEVVSCEDLLDVRP